MNFSFGKEDDPWKDKRIGSPGQSVVLGGRPFIVYFNWTGHGELCLVDVSDPLQPRKALEYHNGDNVLPGWAYSTICFTKDGDIVVSGNYKVSFSLIKFTGLDARNNPTFDFAHPRKIGSDVDPVAGRGMKSIEALASDRTTGDIYYLAVSEDHHKMVPAWGADGTGVGKTTPDGAPKWFALTPAATICP